MTQRNAGSCTLRFIAGWISLLATTAVCADPPEVSYVHPDYPTTGPRIVTGERFTADGAHLEVLCWSPPDSREEVEIGLQAWADGQPPAWPAEPPHDAVRVPVLDSEPGTAVAALSGEVLWVRTPEGVSRPYVFNVAMPWWLLEDEEPDTEAIAKALETAGKERAVVYFPPGRWRTEETLVVPEGVTLCGAGRELSVIEGVGEPPDPAAQTTALVHPGSSVTLERLAFAGVVYRGPGAYWEGTIVGAPVPGGLHHVTVRECRIIGQEARVSDRRGFWPDVGHARGAYRMALALAEGHHHRVLDNDIVGPVNGGSVYEPLRRNEWTGNVIHGGGSADMVSLSLVVEESLVDANRLIDAPGRFMVTSPWHTLIRYNEVQDMWRGSWANAEETYLQHGGANDGADWAPKTLGIASAATATTLTDAGRAWKSDVYRGACVLITAGRGFGQWRRIMANDATTLTLAEPWRVIPDATSEYCAERFFVENTYFANVNDSPGRLSLWLDCIGCLVDSHRDVFSGGLDVWGGENTSPQDVEHQPGKPNYYPSFYNHFARCWLDGAPAWFYCDVRTDAAPRGPMLFGCHMTECMANQAHAARTGFAMQRPYSGAVSVGGHVPRELASPQSDRVGLEHTIVANNSLSWTPVGVTVGQYARKTFVVGNTFEGVEQPLLDWGLRTFFLNNTRLHLNQQGHTQEPLPDVRSEREVRAGGGL